MWDLPGPGPELVSPALAGGFLATAPPGKPSIILLWRESRQWVKEERGWGEGVHVPKPASCGLGEISPDRRETQLFLLLSGLSLICLILLFRVHRN